MATALRRLGYIADFFTPADNRAWFRALLVASLESHLPVVLLLRKKQTTGAGEVDVGHAITLTGFSEPQKIVDVPCSLDTVPPLRMRSGSLDIVYAHDDNLGPHAHYELLDDDKGDEDGHKQLVLQRGDSRGPRPATWPVDRWQVVAALVPKPEKLRLSISSLLENIAYFRPWLELAFEPLSLHYKGYFGTGVQVKKTLLKEHVDVNERNAILFGLSLPRHVGIMSVSYDQIHLCEVVIDVTEVNRNPGEPSLLAVLATGVPRLSQAGIRLRAIAGRFGLPIVHRRT